MAKNSLYYTKLQEMNKQSTFDVEDIKHLTIRVIVNPLGLQPSLISYNPNPKSKLACRYDYPPKQSYLPLSDHSLFKGEFKNRHSSNWRLTDRGREQAEAAGNWLKENGFSRNEIDRYLVSEYLRSMETAARLGLPDQSMKWYAEMLLRERDWGQMDLMSEEERYIQMKDEMKRRDLDRFYYAPPGGESIASVAQRADRLLSALHRDCADKKIICVCHGEVMWALRTRIERMSTDQFNQLQESGRMVDQIHYGHILHYTREDPITKILAPHFTHMRSVCPWDTTLSPKGWVKIERPVYDTKMLLAIAERTPRMIVSDEYIKQTYKDDDKDNGSLLKEKNVNIISKQLNELTLKKVVLANKMTRYQHESNLYGHTGEDLKQQMSMRGFVYDRLKASHDHHVEAVDDIAQSFEREGVDVSVVMAHELDHTSLKGIDMVISAGGDGTFLKAASFVNEPVPVLGVNTDPDRSEGKLCTVSIDLARKTFKPALDRILKGDFTWRNRQRIRVVLVNQDGTKYELPRYALNEVFIAESDASRPSFYDIGIDQHQREVQRSSGIIVTTGTGSSAWYYSASQIHREQVLGVLSVMNHTHTNERVTEITQMLNKQNIFPEDSTAMGYIVREPIINATFGDIRHRCGRARRVSMRSLGWDITLNLDGIYSVPLDYGVQAVMKICTEPNYILRSIDFPN